MNNVLMMLVMMMLSSAGFGAIKTEKVIYKLGSVEMEGFLAFDDTKAAKRPAAVIVHDWMGPSEYTEMRAKQLAELGYVAFAADIYGKDSHPKNQDEAAKLAGEYRNGDRKLLRSRAEAAFKYVSGLPQVDKKHIVALGYCFGGTTALEMARMGLPLSGVLSFHGGLSTANPKDAKQIKAKLLVMHGAIDPNVKPEEVNAFMTEMNDAKVDYQFIAYSGAVHAFTQKAAGNDNSKGAAYNEVADRRSFEAMKTFLKEVNP